MNKKNNTIALITTMIMAVFIFLIGLKTTPKKEVAKEVYQIYLDGNKIGMIDNESDLYALINDEQKAIKEEYDVDQVYPPKGFSSEKYLTYNDTTTSVTNIYNQIKEAKDFTVKGYTITVSSEETDTEEAKVLFRINVLDKQIFEDAINQVIKSFISQEKYDDYINNNQKEIVDTGSRIENIYFQENISIKETYVSTEEKIFTSSDELSKYLLFGANNKEKMYTVKTGDTIASIAEENELNVSEFLVANPNYRDESDLLAVGDQVVISLIDPMLTLVYDLYTVEDTPINYETVTKYDYSKPSSYKKVETAGVKGIRRVASRTQVINGDSNQGAVIDASNSYVIKEAINEVVIRGRQTISSGNSYYFDDGTNWAWPTNQPYTISSRFGTRYLFERTQHDGLDISGTGYGSPIYAIQSGTVVYAGYGGYAGRSAGINVIIAHPNGYYSLYAHLSSVNVKAGDIVERKQRIASMGNSGLVTGTHLHLGISYGNIPYQPGSRFINPELLYK